MSRPDLEVLRTIFKDNRVHLAVGIVKQVEPSPTRSDCRCKVSIYPEEYPVVAKTSFPLVGPASGVVQLPQVDDFVIVAFMTQTDQPYIIARLNSPEDTLPLQSLLGHLVLRALSGKPARLESDEAVYIGDGGLLDPTQPLVLGNVLKDQQVALYQSFTDLVDKLDAILDTIIAGPIAVTTTPGNPAPTHPTVIADLTLKKVDLLAIKTQLAADKAFQKECPAARWPASIRPSRRQSQRACPASSSLYHPDPPRCGCGA